ncbi:MAG TPA: hypothetical protein VF453_00510 [Burkholderiaceae bacterium]
MKHLFSLTAGLLLATLAAHAAADAPPAGVWIGSGASYRHDFAFDFHPDGSLRLLGRVTDEMTARRARMPADERAAFDAHTTTLAGGLWLAMPGTWRMLDDGRVHLHGDPPPGRDKAFDMDFALRVVDARHVKLRTEFGIEQTLEPLEP